MDKLSEMIEKARTAKTLVLDSFTLAKENQKEEAEEKLCQAEQCLGIATEISSGIFREDRDEYVSLRIAHAMDILSDSQTMLELGRALLDAFYANER